jgi:hypothetical protein
MTDAVRRIAQALQDAGGVGVFMPQRDAPAFDANSDRMQPNYAYGNESGYQLGNPAIDPRMNVPQINGNPWWMGAKTTGANL